MKLKRSLLLNGTAKMIEKITSLTNEKIKEATKLAQKKYREESGLFLAEGFKTIRAAFDFGYEIERIFVLEEKSANFEFAKGKLTIVTPEVMKKLSTTDSIASSVAVIRAKEFKAADLKNKKRLLLLENIKDPGNLGTILRSAAAFNIDGIIFAGDCVDIFNTKVLRSTVGTAFMLPHIKIEIKDLKKLFPSHTLISTSLHEKKTDSLENLAIKEPFIVAFGSEADGITDELAKISDKFLKIEHNKQVESLNLSVAASIVLWELSKKLK